MSFTVEEINLMCIYDTSSRTTLIGQMEEAAPYVDEPELAEMMARVLEKLAAMLDADFAALDLYPAEFEDMED